MSAVFGAGAVALSGLDGNAIRVEAAQSAQLPGLTLVGLPDAALGEAKQRVRLATAQSGFPITEGHLTVNLSPAALPKHGTGFDLAIALAALAALGHAPAPHLESTAHIAELGLDGTLLRVPGLLASVILARTLGFVRAMVPAGCVAEAELVSGIEIIGVVSLLHALAWHGAEPPEEALLRAEERAIRLGPGPVSGAETARHPRKTQAPHRGGRPGPGRGDPRVDPADRDLSDVIGQPEAVDAVIVAAAGRHHLLMVGPPGCGKSLLALRMPTILPELADDAALAASSIASLQASQPLAALVRTPPFEAPHHTASAVAIIGGGSQGSLLPGAVTRASHGVLFLDEVAEFKPHVLDALRQPLEEGVVEIQRARTRAVLPARVQLVMAANPCPCGFATEALGAAEDTECTCSPEQRRRYLSRVSGPLQDRIDIRITLRRVSSARLQIGGAAALAPGAGAGQDDLGGRGNAFEAPWDAGNVTGANNSTGSNNSTGANNSTGEGTGRIAGNGPRDQDDPGSRGVPPPMTSARAAGMVAAARDRQRVRLAGTPWTVNAEVSGSWLRSEARRLPSSATVALDRALAVGRLSLRGYDRTLRLAWTVADLSGVDQPGRPEVARALALRMGIPS